MQKVLLITSDFSPRVGGVATYYSTLQNNVDKYIKKNEILNTSI